MDGVPGGEVKDELISIAARRDSLQRDDARQEAAEMLRGPIDAIVLAPENGPLQIELRGNLPRCRRPAEKTKRSPETSDRHVPVQLVAGAGFEPATFGL